MARPALRIEIPSKDKKELRKLLTGGVQQVRVVLRALYEKERPGAAALLEDSQQQRIIAMVCSDPPEGCARWTVRLVAEEAVKRRLVPRVGRETIRVLLLPHDRKPWREKMWCVPELNREYVERMEDVLNLMEKPARAREPVVALDERPVQLHATERNGRPMAPGRIAQRDYEYVRRGTANIFCIVAPKTGRHLTHATASRKARRFAAAMKRISDVYRDAKRIHIILDNLNTHCLKSLTDVYCETEGRRLWRRFVIHHTPKHGSWLNPAEIEVSLWSRECIGRDRIATLCELKYRTHLWNKTADRARRKITGRQIATKLSRSCTHWSRRETIRPAPVAGRCAFQSWLGTTRGPED